MSAKIICVGAIYIDTILTVPHFPHEDQKLRATKRIRRRGGNCGNTLEVLGQLVDHLQDGTSHPSLHLVSVLPSSTSADTKFIKESFGTDNVPLDPGCIYRHEHSEAASSFIIRSAENGSRTIVNINELPEMTELDFCDKAVKLSQGSGGWYHFEGRIPEITFKCVEWLRTASIEALKDNSIKISIELEKPDRREGLDKIVPYADVLFYSKLWAAAQGFTSARQFLENEVLRAKAG